MNHNPARLYKGPVGLVLDPLVRHLRGRGLASRYWWVWKAHRAVWRATRSDRVVIGGHDYLLDLGDSLALSSGRYAPAEQAWYESVVKPGDVIVEAGANIGFFTLILARLVGPEGRVVCYEPDPMLANILRRNVEVNGYRNVAVRQAACSNETGGATFYRSPVSTGDNRLFAHGPNDDSFRVDVVRIDEDLARLGVDRVDLVKMDIQGAEPLAVDGMSGLLSQAPPGRMLIEFMPSGMIGMGNDPVAMIDTLEGHGYRIFVQDGYGITGQDGEPFDVRSALEIMTVENEKWVNIACIHSATG